MALPISGQVGPAAISAGDGAALPIRQGKTGDVVVSELHGRFFEQTLRGNVYSTGMTITSISNATFTSATLGATCTPIVGVWNPLASTVNLVILQADLSVILTALTTTGGAPFVWAVSTGNSAISTGLVPFSRKTLLQTGSQAKGFAGTALTGLVNNLVVMGTSVLGGGSGYNVSEIGTAAGFSPYHSGYVENLDGQIIIPPGGVLALLATTTPVAHSAASSILWEEVAL